MTAEAEKITDQVIDGLRRDAMAVRNTPLAMLCGKALRGDIAARERVASIIAAAEEAARKGRTETCDECGADIPDTEPDMVDTSHEPSCSLYPDECE